MIILDDRKVFLFNGGDFLRRENFTKAYLDKLYILGRIINLIFLPIRFKAHLSSKNWQDEISSCTKSILNYKLNVALT